MVGYAAHGGLLLFGLRPVPAGQGQIQLPGSELCVLVEHFVEIAQAEEENTVLVPGLHLLILPLHGGQFCSCHGFVLFYFKSIRR